MREGQKFFNHSNTRSGASMQPTSLKSWMLFIHRWAGLVLAPFFLMIIISGGILALKPIFEDPRITGIPQMVEPTRLIPALDIADPMGRAREMTISPDGSAMTLKAGKRQGAATGLSGTYSIDSGQKLGETEAAPAPDFFRQVEKFHKEFLVDADFLVELCTFAMLAIIIVGPFLGWLRFNNNLRGWHLATGWIFLPFVLLALLTAVLMILHIGKPPKSEFRGSRSDLSIARGIEQIAGNQDVESIISAEKFRGGVTVKFQTRDGHIESFATDGQSAPYPYRPDDRHLVKSIHEGTWAGAWSGFLNLAVSGILTVLTITGMWAWIRRFRRSRKRFGSADADILVTYASQTGTAARLAEATLQALESGGAKVACMSLSGVQPSELARYRHVLIIASTTGEGELAEPGHGFLKALQAGNNLTASFSILALGDRRYRHFCAGGMMIRQALLDAGADEFMEMTCADGAPQKTWREWLSGIEKHLSVSVGEISEPVADHPVSVRLVERTRLDDNACCDTSETWQVIFSIDDDIPFRPGDLLMVSPDESEPERCYSIGSSSRIDRNRIALTVNLHSWNDDAGQVHLGLMSAQLCREIPVGTQLQALVRSHTGFNPPDDPAIPVIMIAAGCGLAPFMGFIEERAACKGETGPLWLLFGNRYREGDFLYRDTLTEWRREDILTELLTSFSRDSDDGGYVTQEIVEYGQQILTLMQDKNALIYVCGRLHLGEGVESALAEVLVRHAGLSKVDAGKTVRNWKGAGRIREDLFA